jgi:uncharacterized RDD family membrane protein YckC
MICPVCKHETTSFLFCQLCDSYLPNVSAGIKAGVGRRLAAYLLDIVAFWVIFGVVMLVSGLLAAAGTAAGGASPDAAVAAGLGWFAAMFWAFVGYFIFILWFLSKGKTPGKWLVAIQVADKRNGNYPGFGRMIVREIFGKWISGFFLGLGYFWAIFDRDGQGWHDKIAGTIVLRKTTVLVPLVVPANPMLSQGQLAGQLPAAQVLTPPPPPAQVR